MRNSVICCEICGRFKPSGKISSRGPLLKPRFKVLNRSRFCSKCYRWLRRIAG